MTNMEKVDINGNRGATLPVFLVGLGTGIVLTLLITPVSGAALRSSIRRKLKDGADWMEGKAKAARDEVVTHATGLRDGVKAAVGAVTHS